LSKLRIARGLIIIFLLSILLLTYLSGCSLFSGRSHVLDINVDCPCDDSHSFSIGDVL